MSVERWAEEQADKPTRSEAIRRLIEFSLAGLMPSLSEENLAFSVPYMSFAASDEKRALTSAQIRAGRALIRWSAEDLSRQSAVSLRTIRRAELNEGQANITARNEIAIRQALETAGVEFTNGNQPGVRLRKGAPPRLAKAAKDPNPTLVPRSGRGVRKR
jgi:hypothetical protein